VLSSFFGSHVLPLNVLQWSFSMHNINDNRGSDRNPKRTYVDRAALHALHEDDLRSGMNTASGATGMSVSAAALNDPQRAAAAIAQQFRKAQQARYQNQSAGRDQASPEARRAVSEQAAPKRAPRLSTSQILLLKRWLIFGSIALAAVCVVVFVNNVLRVGKLTEDIERSKKEEEKLLQQNELFRAEIIRLQAPERITKIARTRLGMVSADQAPKTLAGQP
jgi:cell division protein FtsL